jgi:hypothetical protein
MKSNISNPKLNVKFGFADAFNLPRKVFVRGIQLLLAILLVENVLAADNGLRTESPRSSVKLLTIGNSFADNAIALLPELAKAGGKTITIFPANLGGHSLKQHAIYVQAFEADPNDPKGRAYKKRKDPRTGKIRDFSLREALQSEDWDVVNIQQVSNLSFKPDTYQPYANILIETSEKGCLNCLF